MFVKGGEANGICHDRDMPYSAHNEYKYPNNTIQHTEHAGIKLTVEKTNCDYFSLLTLSDSLHEFD